MSRQLPLANVVTLGVADFASERDFYRRLGWPLVLDSDDLVAFELRGAVLTLFGLDDLARDAHARAERGGGVSAPRSSSRSTYPSRWTSWSSRLVKRAHG